MYLKKHNLICWCARAVYMLLLETDYNLYLMNVTVYEQQKFENNTFRKIKLQFWVRKFLLLFIIVSDLVQYSISSHINR